jgi:hypothetical protein
MTEQIVGTPPNMGKNSPIPEELKGFNWGAFWWGLSLIWAIAHKAWAIIIFHILLLIPFVNFVVAFATIPLCIFFGFQGNKWAWQNKNWASIDEFQKVQRKWGTWCSIVVVAFMILPIIVIGTTALNTKMFGGLERFGEDMFFCTPTKILLENAYIGKNFSSSKDLLNTAFDHSRANYSVNPNVTLSYKDKPLRQVAPKIIGDNSMVVGATTLEFFSKGSCEKGLSNCGVVVRVPDADRDKIFCRFFIENDGELIEAK